MSQTYAVRLPSFVAAVLTALIVSGGATAREPPAVKDASPPPVAADPVGKDAAGLDAAGLDAAGLDAGPGRDADAGLKAATSAIAAAVADSSGAGLKAATSAIAAAVADSSGAESSSSRSPGAGAVGVKAPVAVKTKPTLKETCLVDADCVGGHCKCEKGVACVCVAGPLVHKPLITNDAVVFGILIVLLALIFAAESSTNSTLKKFFKYVPGLLLCYFAPSLLSSLGIIGGESSQLYFVASRYLLPACLVLLTLSIDLRGILRLGRKALIMFLTGTVGIVIGGPIALLICRPFFPRLFTEQGPEATWRGMTTVAGSWIGGGANQTAMKEVYEVGDQIFSAMIAVDVLCANAWMAILLYMAANSAKIDAKVGADATAIDALRIKVEEEQKALAHTPNLTQLMGMLALAFGGTALGHLAGDIFAPAIKEHAPYLAKFSLTSGFFWLIVVATAFGIGLSFTKARSYSGYGASRIGSAFLYVLVATIGMKMNLLAVFDKPELFVVGFIWLGIHAGLLLLVGRIIRAPVFFLAVGSQANVGGAASAPVVASAFHPALAPVGVLLAVFGYGIGTYAAYICGQFLRLLSE